MPIIATRASAAYGAGFAAITAPPFVVVGSYDALSSVTVPSGGLTSITFSGIPTGYQHLQIRLLARATGSFNFVDGLIQFNGDGGSNYAYHGLTADGGGGTPVVNGTSTVAGRFARNNFPANNIGASIFGGYTIDILDYSSSLKNTTVKSIGGFDGNGQGCVGFFSSLWMNTSAVTSVTLTTDGGNFAQFSSFALYGVK